jgi:serine protease Do
MAGLCLLAGPVLAHAQGAIPDLEATSRSVRELARRVAPAVVEVVATGYAPEPGGVSSGLLARRRGTGSGVLLSADGYLVTNAHVVANARWIQVALPSGSGEGQSILRGQGRVVGAQLVGSDAETDLAVLKVPESGLPHLELGDSDDLRQGDLVFAFGSPLGLEHSMSMGVVSSVARQLAPESPMIYLQTDAAINPGNSGGALVDSSGRLVGVNTLILSQSGGNEGIGFAAPANIVRAIFDQIRSTGRVRRGEIGARTQTLTPVLAEALGLAHRDGVVVSDVHPQGPAAAAGLQIGDVVLALDGKPMENARQLLVNLYPRPPGTSVRLDVLRGSRALSVTPTIRERRGDPASIARLVTPEKNLIAELGVLVLDLDERVRPLLPPLRASAGVVVAGGSADVPFGSDPLLPGDVIYAGNGKQLTSIAGLKSLLSGMAPGQPLAFQVERAGELRFVAVEVLANPSSR